MKRSRIWIFDEGRLQSALAAYQAEALAAYPAQAERIQLTVLAIGDFLHSTHAKSLVMGQENETE
jgi:hypothetical protein